VCRDCGGASDVNVKTQAKLPAIAFQRDSKFSAQALQIIIIFL